MRQMNQEQPFHPIYNYAVVTDSEEGLILVDVNTLNDGEPRNNFLKRAATWNEGGVLNGARHITLAGHHAYIATDAGMAGIDPKEPVEAREGGTMTLGEGPASAPGFPIIWGADAQWAKMFAVTWRGSPEGG